MFKHSCSYCTNHWPFDKKNFGISSLKDWELKIIEATLEGQNILIIQPIRLAIFPIIALHYWESNSCFTSAETLNLYVQH